MLLLSRWSSQQILSKCPQTAVRCGCFISLCASQQAGRSRYRLSLEQQLIVQALFLVIDLHAQIQHSASKIGAAVENTLGALFTAPFSDKGYQVQEIGKPIHLELKLALVAALHRTLYNSEQIQHCVNCAEATALVHRWRTMIMSAKWQWILLLKTW